MFDRINEGRWWDLGWQLVEGCTKCSPGCDNCWSLTKENRFRKETGIVFHEERLLRPIKRKKPTSFAIWNDLFHESISFELIEKAYNVMIQCSHHTFQILTKRPKRANQFLMHYLDYKHEHSSPFIPENIWIGTTVENQAMANRRLPELIKIPAKIKFVSCEPLLSELNISMWLTSGFLEPPFTDSVNWVIAGPETGPKKRPMKKEWIENLAIQCLTYDIPFFDKKDILGQGLKQFPNI